MSYQVLARKWRPQVFEEVVGQQAITRTLKNALETERLHHAYLFSGARGVGKTTTARLLAKGLNCHKTDRPNPTPCAVSNDDACVSCKEVSESRSMDVLEFDAASHTKVEEIREIILESININPARDRFKVFIIDEVHMLSKSSFNALLKTLEEPPDNVIFVMATTELHKVPDTITSRCQEFEFRTIPLKDILERLSTIAEAEKIEISEDALKEVARSGEGSMRDAQSNFDQVISFSGEKIGSEEVSAALGIAGTENLTRTMKAVADRDSEEILRVVDDLVARGHDLRNFCRDLMAFVRDLLVFHIAGDAHGLLDTAILSAEEMKEHSAPFLESDLIRFFNSLAKTEAALRDAAEPRFVLEIGLVKLAEMRRVKAVEDLVARLNSIIEDSRTTKEPQENTAAAAAPEKKTPEPEELTAEKAPEPPEQVEEPEATQFSVQEPETYETEADPFPEEPLPVQFEEPVSSDLLDPDLMPVRLPPIPAEDLEHVEDKWLDAAYETALLRSGDDGRPIGGVSDLVSGLIGKARVKSENGTIATAVPPENGSSTNKAAELARELAMMQEIDEPVPELPEDPSEEDLLAYAENHPLVKRARRMFRGEIISVKKR